MYISKKETTMSLQQYQRSYQYDKGFNLLQQSPGNIQRSKRMVVSRQSNRAIDELLYNSLDLTPFEKANLEQTLQDKGIFDPHGNQLKTGTIDQLSWNHENGLQCTSSKREDGSVLKECSTYAVPGRRSRKVAETVDTKEQIVKIHETIYLNSVEFHTIWMGANLSYDGKTVENNGEAIEPYEQYSLLRIREGHKQVARRKVYHYQHGVSTADTEVRTSYILSNSIDSCQLMLNDKGTLQSYLDYRPYGATSVAEGDTASQTCRFSGQEHESSGLYRFSPHIYLPGNFRWMSPGRSGANPYAYSPSNSFAKDTPVMVEGTDYTARFQNSMNAGNDSGLKEGLEFRYAFKRIQDIKQGDRVWSYDLETATPELRKVTQVFSGQADFMVLLEVENRAEPGQNSGLKNTIVTTIGHSFYVSFEEDGMARMEFVAALDLLKIITNSEVDLAKKSDYGMHYMTYQYKAEATYDHLHLLSPFQEKEALSMNHASLLFAKDKTFVFNLEVDKNHNYLVGNASALTHNPIYFVLNEHFNEDIADKDLDNFYTYDYKRHGEYLTRLIVRKKSDANNAHDSSFHNRIQKMSEAEDLYFQIAYLDDNDPIMQPNEVTTYGNTGFDIVESGKVLQIRTIINARYEDMFMKDIYRGGTFVHEVVGHGYAMYEIFQALSKYKASKNPGYLRFAALVGSTNIYDQMVKMMGEKSVQAQQYAKGYHALLLPNLVLEMASDLKINEGTKILKYYKKEFGMEWQKMKKREPKSGFYNEEGMQTITSLLFKKSIAYQPALPAKQNAVVQMPAKYRPSLSTGIYGTHVH